MPITVPRTVPARHHQEFVERLHHLAPYQGKTLIFAADHKFEHGLPLAPSHFFTIAQESKLVIASHLGLISRYVGGMEPIVIKITAKTPTQKIRKYDPNSTLLTTIDEVINFNKNNHNKVAGVGITIYLGSTHEELMLANASQAITKAHEHGIPTILWSYVRGSAIENKKAHTYLPLAASIATSLGADFAKVQLPEGDLLDHTKLLEETKIAAGNTRLLFAGGEETSIRDLLQKTDYLVHKLGWSGGAIGRNIFAHPTNYACLITQTMTKLMAGEIDLDHALAQIS